MSMKLLKSQKNDIFTQLSKANLSPRDFEWHQLDGHFHGRPISALRMIPKSESYCNLLSH